MSTPDKDPPATSTTAAHSQKRLEVIIAGSAVLVSFVGIMATYCSNENARKDRLALDDRAMKERAFVRKSAENLRLLDTRIAAVERLQKAYSNFQSTYVIYITDYGDSVIARTLEMIELERGGTSEPTEYEMEKEDFARSNEKLLESSMLLRNEFVACALVFDFKQPDVEFLNKLTGNPLDRMQKHLALAKDRITSVARQAEASVKSTGKVKADAEASVKSTGKVKADLIQEATIEIISVIHEDLLADALEIERKYSTFHKTCWESIIDTKQERASDSLTAPPDPP
jgi:hypothetical protein